MLFAVYGDPDDPRTQSTVAKHLGDALAARPELLLTRVDTSLSLPSRLVAAAANVRLSRERWRAAMHGSAWTIRSRTRPLRRALAAPGGQPVEAVIQLRAAYEPIELPYYPYLDNTADLARRHWPPSAPWGDRRLARIRELERRCFGGAAHVFVTGRLVAESLTATYGVAPERVSIVGAGSRTSRVPEAADRPREPWILFVGYDFHRKGGDRLVRAFREVRRRHPEARLKIAGPDVRIDEPGVDVLGRVTDRAQLEALYSAARVFALPVRYEPYGVAFVEAMAHGLPCVGTDVAAVAEIIRDGETGLVVPAGDEGRLTEALATLVADPALARRLGAAGGRRVEAELNWEHVARRMAAVIAQTSDA
ncbi:MAG TPA: glycosyltransferase family 4 protein [Solirubrobacteraceae bacterium]|nr:glycosyltransferase family 4 protein [Solirubrobacteraceae bacterium]